MGVLRVRIFPKKKVIFEKIWYFKARNEFLPTSEIFFSFSPPLKSVQRTPLIYYVVYYYIQMKLKTGKTARTKRHRHIFQRRVACHAHFARTNFRRRVGRAKKSVYFPATLSAHGHARSKISLFPNRSAIFTRRCVPSCQTRCARLLISQAGSLRTRRAPSFATQRHLHPRLLAKKFSHENSTRFDRAPKRAGERKLAGREREREWPARRRRGGRQTIRSGSVRASEHRARRNEPRSKVARRERGTHTERATQ